MLRQRRTNKGWVVRLSLVVAVLLSGCAVDKVSDSTDEVVAIPETSELKVEFVSDEAIVGIEPIRLYEPRSRGRSDLAGTQPPLNDKGMGRLSAKRSKSVDRVDRYYNSLSKVTESLGSEGVPFDYASTTSVEGENILEFARRVSFPELDPVHLAVALLQINSDILYDSDPQKLKTGLALRMPSVRELNNAKASYEKVVVVERFKNHDPVIEVLSYNVMRKGERLPDAKNPNTNGSVQSVNDEKYSQVDRISIPVVGTGLVNSDNYLLGESKDSDEIVDYSNIKVQRLSVYGSEDNDGSWNESIDGEISGIDIGKGWTNYDEEMSQSAQFVLDVSDGTEDDFLAASDKNSGEVIFRTWSRVLQGAKVRTVSPGDKNSAPNRVSENWQENASAVQSSRIVDRSNDYYIGLASKRGGAFTELKVGGAADHDPLSFVVEWDFKNGSDVGNAVDKLAKFIGYKLVVDNRDVRDVYSRELPMTHRRIAGVTAETGIMVLGGVGLLTVFDHLRREVKHVPRKMYVKKAGADSLSECPDELSVASSAGMSAEGSDVFRLKDGSECVY